MVRMHLRFIMYPYIALLNLCFMSSVYFEAFLTLYRL